MWSEPWEVHAKWGILCTSHNPQWHHFPSSLEMSLIQSSLSPPQGNPSKAPYCKSWLEVEIQGHLLCASPYFFTFRESFSNEIDSPLLLRNLPFSRTHWLAPHSSPDPLPSTTIVVHHHFSYSHPDLPQLDAATLGFCTGPQRGPQSCVPRKTSTRIRDLSAEDIPLGIRLLWKAQDSGPESRRDLKVWSRKWVYLKIKHFSIQSFGNQSVSTSAKS